MIELGVFYREALDFFSRFYHGGVRIYWLFLFSALLLAGISFLRYRQEGESASLRDFARFLFPKSVWFNRSALVDYRYFILVVPFWTAVVGPVLLSAVSVGAWVADLVRPMTSTSLSDTSPLVVGVIYTLSIFLADDFRRYAVHYLFHRVPFLWEFHKVHHSAEVLTPITLYREHPVYLLTSRLTGATLIGVTTGMFIGLFGDQLSVFTVLGVNVGFFLFDVMGSNLRHSHIWLSWGRRLEHIIISPAQHQIHHSDQPKHYDKNFGSALAIWDWMFGTLYVPERREDLSFGLPYERERWFDSAFGLIVKPFYNAYSVLIRMLA